MTEKTLGRAADPFDDPALAHGLLEAAPDGVVITDAEGTIRLVNRQTEALLGYTRAELVGQPVELLVPDASRGVHPTHRSRYVQDGSTRPMGAGLQLRARRKDGSEFPADIALSTMVGEW